MRFSSEMCNWYSCQVYLSVSSCTDPWFPDEINDGHAEYLFYLLSGMMGLFFLGYLVVAKLYKYTDIPNEGDAETEIVPDSSIMDERRRTRTETADSTITGF
jgi:hypothetical protein